MALPLAKADLGTFFEPFQNELHKGKDLTSCVTPIINPTTWHTQVPSKMHVSQTDNNEVTYTANNGMHHLRHVYMRAFFPRLSVRKEHQDNVEICWASNPGHNIVSKVQFKIDDDVLCSHDSVYYDMYAQHYIQDKGQYYEDIGNRPHLQEWGSSLPAFTATVPQPMSFSRTTSQAIPMLLSPNSSYTFRYVLRLGVGDLLRMRIKSKEGPWKELATVNLAWLEGYSSDGKLKTPELWARYIHLSEDEHDWWIKCKDDFNYYLEDVITCDTTTAAEHSSIVSVELDCKTPCKAILWVAENVRARTSHNFSNYTTNSLEADQGKHPIQRITFMYNGMARLEEMDIEHFSIAEPFHYFPARPNKQGYASISFAEEPNNQKDADIGLVLNGKKAQLICTLRDEDLGDEPGEVSDEKFIIRVRLIVMRKLTFKKDLEKKRHIISVT